MPIEGFDACAEMVDGLRGAAAWVGEDVLWFDAHTHEGQNDPDGRTATAAEVLEGLDQAGHRRALIFSTHEPGGDYGPANDHVLESVRASEGRLDALCRVDPSRPGAVEEARRGFERGARGVKLHPRSDGFVLPHPTVAELATVVAEHDGILLFHAGRGIPRLGEAALDIVRENARCNVVLAHAGISDLGLLAGPAHELTNLYFDTAWWNVADLLALMTSIPPGRILYASDMPYGPGALAAFNFARTAKAAGWSAEQASIAAGEQLRRLLDHEPVADLGPALGEGALQPRSAALERVTTHGAVASMVGRLAAEGMPEMLATARLGCQVVGAEPHAELLRACDRLLARGDEDPAQALYFAWTAHVLAGTPEAGVPDPALV